MNRASGNSNKDMHVNNVPVVEDYTFCGCSLAGAGRPARLIEKVKN